MNGEDILNEVRFLIDDMGYSRYNEINRAYREIGRVTHHNWLRNESETLITFVDGTAEYTIDLDGVRVFKELWVKGNDSGAKYWHLMEEVSSQLFEDRRVDYLEPDGTDREDRPAYYKILSSTSQVISVQVTPVPDDSYDGRVNYIKDLETISRTTTPTMPASYHDLIANMAAGMILSRDKDPKERARGQGLKNDALRNAVNGLVKDAHTNRTKNITRPRRSTNQFI